jgi:hypothetical protein
MELAYDEAKDYRVGGEDDSSRAHGVPDGDYDDELYGTRTVLNEEFQRPLAPSNLRGGIFLDLHRRISTPPGPL